MGWLTGAGLSFWAANTTFLVTGWFMIITNQQLGASQPRCRPLPICPPTQPSARLSFRGQPLSIQVETPAKGRRGCSRMTVSPGAKQLIHSAVGTARLLPSQLPLHLLRRHRTGIDPAAANSRRRDCHLMAPPCTFSGRFNRDKQGVPSK